MRVGVFDSGIGGLSVVQHLLHHNLELIYLADSAYVPYGTKTTAQIQQRSIQIVEYFLSMQCQAVVVACNTATAAAIGMLRERFSIPFVGIEPAIKPALLASKTGKVAVFATQSTLESERFKQLLQPAVQQPFLMACSDWVSAVEHNWSPEAINSTLERYVAPALHYGADVAVLGCTHFPFLAAHIEAYAPQLKLIEPGAAVASRVQDLLGLDGNCKVSGVRFVSTGSATLVQQQIATLAQQASWLQGLKTQVEAVNI